MHTSTPHVSHAKQKNQIEEKDDLAGPRYIFPAKLVLCSLEKEQNDSLCGSRLPRRPPRFHPNVKILLWTTSFVITSIYKAALAPSAVASVCSVVATVFNEYFTHPLLLREKSPNRFAANKKLSKFIPLGANPVVVFTTSNSYASRYRSAVSLKVTGS